MPWSAEENKPWIIEQMLELDPLSVLDVGAGAGVYGRLVRQSLPNVTKLDAVEIWTPYVSRFGLDKIYDEVFLDDIRIRSFPPSSYDVVIMGDVLEHMTKLQATLVWNHMLGVANKAVIMSVPIIHYPQGHAEGNPYEEHVKDDWTAGEVLDSFMGITDYNTFDVTGVFIADRRADIWS